jgi:Domain of unknown function (DUF4168)
MSNAKGRNGMDQDFGMSDVSDEMVTRVGRALGQVAEISETFRARLAEARTEQEQEGIEDEAAEAAVRAIDGQGISLAQYEQVLTAAEADPELEIRLISAARGND